MQMCRIIISDGQCMMPTDFKKVKKKLDGFVTYKKINRQHRRRFGDIETISKR